MLKSLIQLLFPTRCVSCGSVGTFLCAPCIESASELPSKELFSHGYALYSYKSPSVMSALRALKYRGIRDVADIFAEKLADKISAGTFGTWPEGEMLLVPIPTTRASARARGYNQSLLLAEALAQRAPERFIVGKDILSKKDGVRKQTGMRTREERFKNMDGALFVRDADAVSEKNILLIDDIITTGATAREAMRVLKGADLRKVWFLAVAH